MQFLGFDLGSSSVKASVIDGASGICLASAVYPEQEMDISVPQAGWAEQSPVTWWENLIRVTHKLLKVSPVLPGQIKSIGISYQMHGLVLIDKDKKVLRPAIIWCDSRSVETGSRAFKALGEEFCLDHLLNSPGNFTASKLGWVKKNEPELYDKIYKLMLPGDYIAMKLTGEVNSTISGMSEGIFWDFKKHELSSQLLDYFGFDAEIFPDLIPAFGEQGRLSSEAALELGLIPDIPVSYRAGDQPNNAFSLKVLDPGELAATAGTSGVVYGVSDIRKYDPLSRINTFAHVNHQPPEKDRYGVLLCVNGTGILNAWLKRNMGPDAITYEEMNQMASGIPAGSDGLTILPFGNGAERILQNKNPGASVQGLNLNMHSRAHFFRAVQEGIAFSFRYGMDIMKGVGIDPKVIRAGNANMFLSPLFCSTLSGITGAEIEIYDTDGAQGAARGAAIGAGYYKSFSEAFVSLKKIGEYQPGKNSEMLETVYNKWLKILQRQLNQDSVE